jgi:hypothetical protein
MTRRDLMDIAKASQEAAKLDLAVEAVETAIAEADESFCCVDCEIVGYYALQGAVKANEEVLFSLGV